MNCGLTDLLPSLRCAGRCTALVDNWQDAWNRHDAGLLTRLVATDVDFVTVAGRWLRGHSEFREWHGLIHRSHLQASRWTNLACLSRSLHGNLTLVHLEWRIDNEIQEASHLPVSRLGLFTWVVASEGEVAHIMAAHNTNLGKTTLHRLAGAGRGK